MRRYLVVVNQTVGGDDLVEQISDLADDRDIAVHVVAPVGDPEKRQFVDPNLKRLEGAGPDDASLESSAIANAPGVEGVLPDRAPRFGPHERAQQILEQVLAQLRPMAAELSGDVLAADAVEIIRDAVRNARYDGIILATPPPSGSQLLGQDLASRVQRAVDWPVITLHAPRADPTGWQ